MFCQNCGAQLPERAVACPRCGEQAVDWAPQISPLGDSAGLRMLLPVGRSMWAIAAGYLGLFSLLIIPAPLALFCGIMGAREIRRNPQKHGMGRAIFGVVMGSLGTIVLLLAAISFVLK